MAVFGRNFDPDAFLIKLYILSAFKGTSSRENRYRTPPAVDLLLLTLSERKIVKMSGNRLWSKHMSFNHVSATQMIWKSKEYLYIINIIKMFSLFDSKSSNILTNYLGGSFRLSVRQGKITHVFVTVVNR